MGSDATDLVDLIETCRVVDEVAATSTWRHEIGRAAAKRFTEGDRSMNEFEAALVRGLDIELDQRVASTMLNLPWLHDDWPPEASDPEVWFPIWRAALDHIATPAVSAALNDLLWSVRHRPRPDERGRAAVHAYLDETPAGWTRFEVRRSIERACDLARELNDQALLDLAAARLLSEAKTAAEDDVAQALSLIEHLLGGRHGSDHLAAADALLEGLWGYVTSARLLERIVRVRLSRLEGAERTTHVDRVVDAYRSEAANDDGFRRLQLMREAARVAEEWGSALHREVVHQIETEDFEDAFEKIQSNIMLPRAEIDRFVSQVVGADSLLDALSRFSVQLPLKATSVAAIRETMTVSLIHLVTSEVIGEANSVVTSSAQNTDEDHVARAMDRDAKRQAAYSARLTAHAILVPALRQTLVSYEPWDEADLAAGLRADGLCDAVAADALARALRHFAEGRFDEALLIAAPRVERLVRSLARRSCIQTTKRPTAKVGGIRGLGELLGAMRAQVVTPGSFHDDLISAMELTLVDADALNLRNDAEHGISGVADPAEAALVIQLGLLLCLGISFQPPESQSA
jgi:hypothetical protein